jgi:hypothetical protein
MPHQPIKETTFRATVFDPSRPPRLAWVLGLALPFWALSALTVTDGVSALFSTGLATLLALGTLPRRPPRDVLVTCGPGVVRLGRNGTSLRARDVFGATTARVGDRVSLVVGYARRKRNPVVLTLPDEGALHAVCDSLGIGHHGFGIVDAVATPPDVVLLRHWAAGAALVCLLLALFGAPLGSGATAAAALLATVATLVAGLAILTEMGSPRRVIRLTSHGVFVPILLSGSTFVPFATIEHVEVLRNGLSLTVVNAGKPSVVLVPVRLSRWLREGLDPVDLEHLAAQIRAASERAHGRFALKDEPSATVELLRRKGGESLRAWYARLDSIVAGAAGYRGTAVESVDLWKVLEDPEADADLRSAAARVLAQRTPELVRARVGGVLAAVRDDRVRTRIAASLDEEVLEREEQAEAFEEKNRARRA